jgi:hypothetical protein
VIHSIASFSEVNFPTWLFLPLGHVIRTRQILPFCTGDKTVSLSSDKAIYSAACWRFSFNSLRCSAILALWDRSSRPASSL